MSEPIRILHMIGSLNVGGSQAMVINLHKAIDKSKVQFDYIVDHQDHLYYEPTIKELGGRIFILPTFKGYNIIEVRRAWINFFKDHPEYKILHSHVRSYASLYLPIARKAGLKTIIHSHNTSNGNNFVSVIKFILQYPLRYQANYFFACSKNAGTWLFGKKIVHGNRFQILQNAIDVDKYLYSDENRTKIRNEFNLHKKFILGNIGRLTPQKNHQFLIDIFSEVHKQENNSSLLIVGAGSLEGMLKEQVAKLGLSESIIFTGSRDDIPALLSAMDVFVFPSLWEGLGIVAIESQASGLHTLCSDAVPKESQLSDLIEFLSLNDSAKKWADKILQYRNPYERKEIQQTIINAGYDINKSAKRLENFYLSIIKK